MKKGEIKMTKTNARERKRIYDIKYRLLKKEHIKNFKNQYYLKNKEKVLKKNREWKNKNWEKWNEYNKEWQKEYNKKNKHKRTAMDLANYYFDLPNEICPICNERKVQDRHHEDYSKPLEIIFVCKKCHKLLDDQKRARDYDNLNERRFQGKA